MVVFLFVLTIINGSPMAEFWAGVPRDATRSRLRFIRFLKDNIYSTKSYDHVLLDHRLGCLYLNKKILYFISLGLKPLLSLCYLFLLWKRNKIKIYPITTVMWTHCTSMCWHSWAELVGRPIQRISFFSLEMIFIAIKTLRASYTRRRMFFWSIG